MREIVLRPGESIVIGDTVVRVDESKSEVEVGIDSILRPDAYRVMVAAGLAAKVPQTGCFIDREGGDAA